MQPAHVDIAKVRIDPRLLDVASGFTSCTTKVACSLILHFVLYAQKDKASSTFHYLEMLQSDFLCGCNPHCRVGNTGFFGTTKSR